MTGEAEGLQLIVLTVKQTSRGMAEGLRAEGAVLPRAKTFQAGQAHSHRVCVNVLHKNMSVRLATVEPALSVSSALAAVILCISLTEF